jgi:hypothetical protein
MHLSDFAAKPSKGGSNYAVRVALLPFVYQEVRRLSLAAQVRWSPDRGSRMRA